MIRFTFLLFVFVGLLGCSTQPPGQSGQLEQEKQEIHKFLDTWHHAAAMADEDVFFSSFTLNGIYIGTDATEHWKAIELKTWAKAAFEKDVAWAFEPYDRHIYFSEDRHIVWFDELLRTWMGPCRGSGVLQKVNGQYKIAHYHLAVAVPNETIEAYLKLLPQDQIIK